MRPSGQAEWLGWDNFVISFSGFPRDYVAGLSWRQRAAIGFPHATHGFWSEERLSMGGRGSFVRPLCLVSWSVWRITGQEENKYGPACVRVTLPSMARRRGGMWRSATVVTGRPGSESLHASALRRPCCVLWVLFSYSVIISSL